MGDHLDHSSWISSDPHLAFTADPHRQDPLIPVSWISGDLHTSSWVIIWITPHGSGVIPTSRSLLILTDRIHLIPVSWIRGNLHTSSWVIIWITPHGSGVIPTSRIHLIPVSWIRGDLHP